MVRVSAFMVVAFVTFVFDSFISERVLVSLSVSTFDYFTSILEI